MKKFNKFKDAGLLHENYGIGEAAKSKKTATEYSRISIKTKNFPYLQKKSVGDECVVLIKVKKVAELIPDKYDPDKDTKITLEVISIAEPNESDDYEEIVHGGYKDMHD
uniref:Uncharacterized protein n=1 Tax=viral metagenome TaxID=1070528 RepID=A0A6H1ZR20_9ZZZZ